MPVRRGESIDVERTREKLLRAAAELIYERGLSGAGVNQIAATAGVSKLSLYHHFDSKEGLIRAVLQRRSERVQRWLRSSAIDGGDDPHMQLLAVCDALTKWFATPGFRGCALVNAALQGPSDGGPARETAGTHLAVYRELLLELCDRAGVREPEQLSRQLLLVLEGATTVAAVTGDPHAGCDARAAVRALLRGQLV